MYRMYLLLLLSDSWTTGLRQFNLNLHLRSSPVLLIVVQKLLNSLIRRTRTAFFSKINKIISWIRGLSEESLKQCGPSTAIRFWS